MKLLAAVGGVDLNQKMLRMSPYFLGKVITSEAHDLRKLVNLQARAKLSLLPSHDGLRSKKSLNRSPHVTAMAKPVTAGT